MPGWVRVCAITEAPKDGEVTEVEVTGAPICLARIEGRFHAMDNVCPHRQGPLGQGWVEGQAVLCPWHAWAFDVYTGEAAEPEHAKVRVFPVREENGELLVDLA